MVTLNSFYTTPIRQEALGVNIETFTPLTMMGVDPFVLWVHKDSGITTFEQYVEKVKSMNGEYVMGGTGAPVPPITYSPFMDLTFSTYCSNVVMPESL